MNNLGQEIRTVRPGIKKYYIGYAIGGIAMAIPLIKPTAFPNVMLFGIPLTALLLLIGPLIVIICYILMHISMRPAKKNNNFIILYENGLKFGDFIALYQDITMTIISKKIRSKIDLEANNQKATYELPISKQDLQDLIKRVKFTNYSN